MLFYLINANNYFSYILTCVSANDGSNEYLSMQKPVIS